MYRQRLQENKKILFNIQEKKNQTRNTLLIDFRDLIIVFGKVGVRGAHPLHTHRFITGRS